MKTIKASLMVCLFLGGCYLIPDTPERALHDFQTNQHKESYMVLPLCNAGETVVPLVMEKVKDKEMERRRYAIGFLGTSESTEPVAVLEIILNDESEPDYVRYDALESIFVLNEQKGRNLASHYKDRSDLLGEVAYKIRQVSDHAAYKTNYRRKICEPDD